MRVDLDLRQASRPLADKSTASPAGPATVAGLFFCGTHHRAVTRRR